MIVEIDTEFIKLDSLLKFSSIAESGGMAKILIENGEVSVNDEIETRRGRKVYPGDRVELFDEIIEVR